MQGFKKLRRPLHDINFDYLFFAKSLWRLGSSISLKSEREHLIKMKEDK